MKRVICILLLAVLLFSGCANQPKEPVTFYYVRSDFETDMSAVIASESREASGHLGDLPYLMALYCMGPAEEELHSPLPAGISILSARQEASNVTLQLTDTTELMTDSQFTLACSCLTLTCLDITQAEYVTINSGDRSVTMGAEILVLQDVTTGSRTEETK